MKFAKFLLFSLLCAFIASCVDDKDNNGAKKNRPEVLAWIEDTMRDYYYWDVPDAGKLNYDMEPEPFFHSLLSKNDGKTYNGQHHPYSYITSLEDKKRGFIQEVTYGFEFLSVRFREGNYGAVILYVLPDSPASEAGLQRGDILMEIDDKRINTDAALTSLFGDVAKTFTVVNYSKEYDQFVNSRKVDIAAAREMENNPIFMAEVLTSGNKKVGYLVYNLFEDGKDEDTVYDDELRSLSSGKFNGVDEFVLDLRYNNGGYLTCAQLICAMLCPNNKLGSILGYLKYKSGRPSPFSVSADRLKPNGRNLNLKRVFVLVSSTSASASEAVINCLEPYMEVIVIGRQTEGKNVGSNPYTNDEETWEMHPITCMISNSENFWDYADGLEPDYDKGDVFDYDSEGYVSFVEVLPLGDPNERLLEIALELIDNTNYIEAKRVSSADGGLLYKQGSVNSLDRKATNGVIIDKEIE